MKKDKLIRKLSCMTLEQKIEYIYKVITKKQNNNK